MENQTIILKNLPKVSLNAWYAGKHWSDRKEMKDNYITIVNSQFRHVFSKDGIYSCHYAFEFKNKPLDASNCVAMAKMIEDIIFEDDKFDIVTNIGFSSCKGKEDKVTIKVIDLKDDI